MTKPNSIRRIAIALFAAPLTVALAACGSGDDAGAAAESAEQAKAIAPIAAPEGQEWADSVVKTDAGGYLMGNPDAPIKLVEFGALTCSHCAEFATESFEELRNEYVNSGRVSYELRFFMLSANDMPFTLLATCSTPEATIPLAEQIWGNLRSFFETAQSAPSSITEQIGKQPLDQRFVSMAQVYGLTDFVTARGISRDQANACLSDTKKAEELANMTRSEAETYDISGTPTFLLNGNKLEAMRWDDMKARLQAAGAR